MLPGLDEDNVFPALTPYSIMLLGKVKLLPFFVPGDPALGKEIRGIAGKRSAVLLANHGPVVAGKKFRICCKCHRRVGKYCQISINFKWTETKVT